MIKCAYIALLAVGIALISSAFRYDLLSFRFNKGYALYRQGNIDEAIAAWSLMTNHEDSAYNRGVAHFRKGDLDQAAREFRTASKTKNPVLRQQSLYNLGTTLLMNGLHTTGAEQEKAIQLLETAAKTLQDSLRLDPGDSDALRNESIATASLKSLRQMIALMLQSEKKVSETLKTGEQSKLADGANRGEHAETSGKPGKEAASGSGKAESRKAHTISEQDALRLLNNARGRETLRSAVAAGHKQADTPPPEKDW